MKLITCYLCASPQVAADACSPGELNAHPQSFSLCLKEICLACLLARYSNSQRVPHHLLVREQVDPASRGGGLTYHTSRAAAHTLTQTRAQVQIVRPVTFQEGFQVHIHITHLITWRAFQHNCFTSARSRICICKQTHECDKNVANFYVLVEMTTNYTWREAATEKKFIPSSQQRSEKNQGHLRKASLFYAFVSILNS